MTTFRTRSEPCTSSAVMTLFSVVLVSTTCVGQEASVARYFTLAIVKRTVFTADGLAAPATVAVIVAR
jgi:hypothetical protein